MKDEKTISAVVISKNEEKKIRKSLESLSWANEILVVDNGSTDRTVSIAKKCGVKIITDEEGGFCELRNIGLKKAKGKWILYIDADERITADLRDEILSLTNDAKRENKYSAYVIPRRNFIFGKEFKHGGQWPDYVKRLFLRSKLKKWVGDVHEEPVFDGEIGYLKNPMIHRKHKYLSEMVEKTNKWSDIEARLMFEANHPDMNVIRFSTAMFREFWLRMIRQLSFLDGSEGIIYGLYQVYSRFISYAKLWEMQIKTKNRS